MKNLNEKEVLEALYNGCSINKIDIDDHIENILNNTELDILYRKEPYTEKFLYPSEYNLSKPEIIEKYKCRCENNKELERFIEELDIFEMIGKIDLVCYFIYLVDILTQNKIIWGVGRGSSVSIFTFYLIGVHKVNCVKYNIDYTDFFKIKENE